VARFRRAIKEGVLRFDELTVLAYA